MFAPHLYNVATVVYLVQSR